MTKRRRRPPTLLSVQRATLAPRFGCDIFVELRGEVQPLGGRVNSAKDIVNEL
jgi:hypothetical protein